MRFGILGPIQVCDADGGQVPVGGPGVRALLARLLVDPGQLVSTGRLVTDLYGEDAPTGAANALQSQVSRVRRLLPAGATIERHPAGYRLAVAPEDVDAHRFTRLAGAGREALAAADPARAASLLDEALDLWRGPALADVSDAPFASAETARWEELRLAATGDRFEARLQLGESARLVTELQELVRRHPLRERPTGHLMRALHGAGRHAEALEVFQDVRRRLAEELGADPSPELAAVHVAILRGEVPDQPPPPGPRGLPAQLTSFLGREEELARVGKLLGDARLVTLTGPGGTGKTRLAIEAVSGQDTERYFADLAALTDGAEVPQTVLGALGLREAGLRAPAASRIDPLERLTAALARRPVLLVLDNCEHVVTEAAALVGRLLAACPQLRVVATSREPLGLTGEALCTVGGLALPPADAPAEQVGRYAAIRLFVDRAASAAPGLVLDDLATVRRICQVLDGLPLAIELAAARLRTLPVAELAARLDDRFALLSRGSRTAQPRHRTLRAVIGWSWDLLDGSEQALARRLSVFAGGAGLDALEQVCGASVDVLSSLVDKSLVEAAAGRYRMLDTVRAYSAEKLVEAGEADRLRQAHAAYFLQVAETADGHLRGAGQLDRLARLDADRDNLHAAVRSAVAAGDVATALGLVSALAFYWWVRGLRGEATTLAGEVLAAAGPGPPPGTADQHAVCVLLASLGGPAEPERHRLLQSAAEIVYRLDRPPRQPFLYYLSAMVSGPPEGGADTIKRMVTDFRDASARDPWMRALSPVGLAIVLARDGELTMARHEAETSAARFRELGERWGLVTALGALAEIAVMRRDPADAAGSANEALALASELGSTVDVADMLRVRAEGGRQAGDLAGAEADYQRAVELARRAGAPEVLAAAHLGLALIAQQRGDLIAARGLAETALAECPTGWFAAELTRTDILAALAELGG